MKTLFCSLALCLATVLSAETPPQSFTIDSKVLHETRRINVYTPPGYAEHGGTRFPVLYMPDGGMAEDFPHVTETVQSLVTEGTMRPFIVIGIENTERRRDMTGPTREEKDKKIAVHVGGSAAFRQFIREELMPQVRSRYHPTEETAIVGESLAGLFIVETFLLEPDLFDTYIAFSPSVWWNDFSLVRGAADWLKAEPKLHKTLYLTHADEQDIMAGTGLLAGALRTGAPAGLVWFYRPMPDEHHGTIYIASAPAAFRTVLGISSKPAASP
ncbi:MAG TPA: alpha/beta hydrolase-fold protein [Thermoanaerobaculia bacterium]|jgi:predicted alpha/beta superfamily hydrolase|nr:alpha/beta hydrolase-fold protein [Thermoanaerobaculia bacterium]